MNGHRYETNGIPPPDIDLPVSPISFYTTMDSAPSLPFSSSSTDVPFEQLPDRPETVTSNLLRITELVQDA